MIVYPGSNFLAMRNPKHRPSYPLIWFMIIALVTLSGCATQKQLWYQQGKKQVDYDRDAQECVLIAKGFARQATMTGRSEDPAAFQRTRLNCLVARGWSMTPPPPPAGKGDASPPSVGAKSLATIDGRTIQAFGSRIELPPRFSLSANTIAGQGPTVVQQFQLRGSGDTFINILAQKTVAKENRFENTPYPVTAPFSLYEQLPGWTIFYGKINNEWVMGLGCYRLINSTERITVIVTRSLTAPRTEPERGFTLSREQFAMVEAFKTEWVAWLEEKVTVPARPWWSSLPQLLLR